MLPSLFPSSVLDLYSRKVVGWSMANRVVLVMKDPATGALEFVSCRGEIRGYMLKVKQ